MRDSIRFLTSVCISSTRPCEFCVAIFSPEAAESIFLTWPTGKRSWAANSPSSRLWLRVFRIFMIRTMAASIWWKRSWSTCSLVFLLSSSLSLHSKM